MVPLLFLPVGSALPIGRSTAIELDAIQDHVFFKDGYLEVKRRVFVCRLIPEERDGGAGSSVTGDVEKVRFQVGAEVYLGACQLVVEGRGSQGLRLEKLGG